MNFSEGASKLAITQSALSRSIQSLEASLGVPLFERNSRKVELTAYGVHLLAHARSAILNVDNIKVEIERLQNIKTGTLVIGSGPLAIDNIVSTTNITFANKYPDVELTLLVDDYLGLIPKLVAGELDLIIMDERLLDDISLYNVQALQEFPGVILVRTGHPLANKKRVTSSDFMGYDFVTFNNAPPEILAGFMGLDASVFKEKLKYSSNDVQSILIMIQNSDRMAILFSCNGLNRVESNLIHRLPYDPGENLVSSQFSLITYKSRVLTPSAQAYLELAMLAS